MVACASQDIPANAHADLHGSDTPLMSMRAMRIASLYHDCAEKKAARRTRTGGASALTPNLDYQAMTRSPRLTSGDGRRKVGRRKVGENRKAEWKGPDGTRNKPPRLGLLY